MTRSITFVAEGDVTTEITITENADGSLTFDLRVTDDSASIGDLRALFFDLEGLTVDAAGFSVYGGDVEEQSFGEAGVDSLGRDANIKGQVTNELGDFDVGIEFGTSGIATDDIRETSFTLFYDPDGDGVSDLSLDMVSLSDFGLRYTSVGEEGGDRSSSAKIGDQSNGVAQDDAVSVDEGTIGTINVLTHGVADTNAASLSVTGIRPPGSQAFVALPAAGFELVRDGAAVAQVTLAADGTLTVDVSSFPGAERLAAGETEVFTFEYQTTAPDGSLASATVSVTVVGLNDLPLVSAPVAATASEEDAVFQVDLLAGASDVDASDTLGVSGLVLLSGDASGVSILGDSLSVDPSAYASLNAGETAVIEYGYQITDGNGGSVAQTATITITGTGGAPAPALFTEDADIVNFGNPASADPAVTAGSYEHGSQYDALGGDDLVFLPGTAADAIAAGYDPGQVFRAGAGNDTVWGGELADVIEGGEGADGIRGGDGDDSLRGGAGNDQIRGEAGDDTLDGGAGTDSAWFSNSPNGVTLTLTLDPTSGIAVGSAIGEGTDSVSGFERYFLTNFDDSVSGSDAAEEFRLFKGTDTIDAGGGDDIIRIGDGDKTIDGGDGVADVLSYYDASSAVKVDLSTGAATGVGVVSLSGIERAIGSAYNDTIIGDAGENTFFGFDGNDTISGGGERDNITGGRGDDVLTGGADIDTFVYVRTQGPEGDDVITDFTIGGDGIRFFGGSYTSLADLNPVQVGADAVLDLGGGDSITLLNVQVADLSDSDFVF